LDFGILELGVFSTITTPVALNGSFPYIENSFVTVSILKSRFIILFLSITAASFAQDFKPYEQNIPSSTVKFKMIPIPAGTFTIGSPATEKSREEDEGPQKKVEVAAFWMAEHETTFAEWDAFFKNLDVPQTKAIAVDAVSRPTAQYIDLTWGMGRDLNNPTNSMSQQAGIMYCKWLFEQTGIFYRLPTEAEWDRENSAAKYHKVKQLKPNAWGLYDMLGNLSEWTLDQYDPAAYEKLADKSKNPSVPPAGKYPRTARGGSYLDEASECRCSNRISSSPEWNKRDPQIPKSRWWLTDGMYMGFRIVRPALQPSKEEIEKFYASYLK
jgi:formylglycine-generating enzyme required for sulfatase activity